ncbi:MAG: SRPBCC family protein [Burkholderiaceae bacterium]|nr:SRPBCC family protein [Burkholderiaceae bacterium]
MTQSKIGHGHFTITRHYDASPARVFKALAGPAVKAKWFIGPDGWNQIAREMDFRVGGDELLQGRFASGMETRFNARYYEIIENERIAYTYDMHLSGSHHSLSVATIELWPDGAGTKFLFTEQVAFFDGTDAEQGTASRKHGTDSHFDRIAQYL